MLNKEEAITELNWLKSSFIDTDFNTKTVAAIDMAITALKFNPQAAREAIDEIINTVHSQPERPKGRWVNGNCTNCGRWCGSVNITILPNLCPNCGADMRGEEE